MELEWLRLFLETRRFSTRWQGELSNEGKKTGNSFSVLEFYRQPETGLPSPQPSATDFPFYLYAKDIENCATGSVIIRNWPQWSHKPDRLKSGADYFRLIEKNFRKNTELPQRANLPVLLLLPGFPVADPWKSRLREFLIEHKIQGCLSLRAILHDLIQQSERAAGQFEHQHTPALDLLRMLRFYDLLKDPQLELFT